MAPHTLPVPGPPRPLEPPTTSARKTLPAPPATLPAAWTVCARHLPRGEALAMAPPHRSPWLPTTSACLSPLCPQGWGPAESHRPLLFPHLTPSAPPWKPTGGSWRHRAPGAPTAPCHRARLAEDTPTQAPRDPSCPLPQLPISHRAPHYTPAGSASKTPSPPPVPSAAAPRLRLSGHQSPGPGPGKSHPPPADLCDVHILPAACAHLTAAA